MKQWRTELSERLGISQAAVRNHLYRDKKIPYPVVRYASKGIVFVRLPTVDTPEILDACSREVPKAINKESLRKRKQYEQAYYLRNKEKYRSQSKRWSASNRHKCVKNVLKSRAKNLPRYKLYMGKWCEDNKEHMAQYREENREKIRLCARNHYLKNRHKYYLKWMKRRALLAKATINLAGIEEWCAKIKGQKTFTCYWCEKQTAIKKLHFDHIVPISRGGSHSIENLCASCSACNLSKGSKLVSEWRKSHGI